MANLLSSATRPKPRLGKLRRFCGRKCEVQTPAWRDKAVDFAADSTKQLIALSTGITALTITFAKQMLVGRSASLELLGWGWGLYVVSIVCGLWSLLAMTGSLARKDEPSIYEGNIRLPSFLQVICFVIATILMVAFALLPGESTRPPVGPLHF